ncbi:MAG: xanthine dehydrogenase family protein molybdopterin-binding subunit [Lentisphaerae bacterium]|jgi:carbon-monoxide dehydrogenase large subunit|nr:xanthine dehydrogenase family protein molybdopterin-binding subunit [Lentisphaerota bacterium]
MAKFKYIGKSLPRPDSVQKALGKAQYLDDIRLPDMLHAAILRPEHAHAEILSIDTSEAEKMPGVVTVVTGKNCKTLYGDNISDISPMAVSRVRHIGDHVAAVIAETKRQATEALQKIKVEYKPLPVYVDARDALAPDAVLIHPDAESYWHLPGLGCVPGTNIANHYRLKKGDVAKGFEEADVIVEGEFLYPHASCAAIEPHGAIARFNEDGTIDIWSSSICPFIIRDDVAHAYNRPSSMVRVRIPEIGGCFGYKSDITVEQTVAWIASHAPGRPVKWVATRREDFTSTLIGHGFRYNMKIGAKKDGTLVAIQSDILHSTGAFSDTGVHVANAATHNCTGPYEFPNALLDCKCVYTNTPPVGAFRGYGHQEGHLPIERLMDILARKLGMDIFALRDKNYLGPGKRNAQGERYYVGNGSVRDCEAKVRAAIYTGEKPAEDETYYYGRGFAAMMKSPKGAPHSSKSCYLKMNPDGSVVINMGGAEVGQGLRNVVRQVAAEALKIPPEKIRAYPELDTQYCPWEWQTIGSMFTTQGGRAIVRAANKAIQMMKETAAKALLVDVDHLEYDGERVFLKHDPDLGIPIQQLIHGYMTETGITIGDVVHTTSDARLPRYSNPDENGQGNLGVEYTFGAQACEIRIEKKTGKVLIDHFASSFDVGTVINPLQIRGQIAGGVMIGIGATLHEEIKYDEKGNILNPSFGKYRFPSLRDAPAKQTIECVENPGEIGPFGARGIGEHPVVAVAPCILNAIQDAIGVDFYEIPITPEKIRAALNK